MVASSLIFAFSHEKSKADTDQDNAGRALALTAMGLIFAYVAGGANSFTLKAVHNLGLAVLSHSFYNALCFIILLSELAIDFK